MRGKSDQSRMRYDEAQPSSVFADEGGNAAASMQPMDLVSPDLGVMTPLEPQRRTKDQVSKPGNGGDALVFIAMGLVSAALGLGLYAHVGIDLPVALLAALCLFVSTSFLHVFVRRMQGVDLLDRRVTALEDKVSQIDEGAVPDLAAVPSQADATSAVPTQPQPEALSHEPALRADSVAPEAKPADVQSDWQSQNTAAQPVGSPDLPPAYQIPSDASVEFAPEQRTTSIADPIYDLANSATSSAKADEERNVREQTTTESHDHAPHARLENDGAPTSASDSRSIDGLVRQLSQGMSSQSGSDVRETGPQGRTPTQAATTAPLGDARVEAEPLQTAPAAIPTFGQRDPAAVARRESGETPLIAMPPKPVAAEPELGMPIASSLDFAEEAAANPIGQAIKDAIQQGNVEIYLQPILSIDDRKVRFFEVLGRVKGVGGDVIATEDHAELTRTVRASAKLDRAIMTRAARLLRKLAERRQAQPLFCNISRETLSSNTFAHEFVEFMGGYRDIAPFMIFEIDHVAISTADTTTLGNLRTLASMGFRLSFDNVANVEQALANGRELDASFIKLGYQTLLPMQQNQADARARAATIQSVARDSGMTLIVDQIERKDQLAGVISAGVNLGQGYLFSEPKPLLPQVAAEVAEDSAAA